MFVARRWIRVLPLLALVCSCQRLEDEPGPVTSAGGGGQNEGGTFLPASDESEGEGTADSADGGGDDGNGVACDPVTQSGCGDGERCTVTGASTGEAIYGCVPDTGLLETFEPCSAAPGGLDDCTAGNACIADFAGSGVCLPLCNVSDNCDFGACSTSTFGDIPYCADDCSPFEPLCTVPTQCRRNGERFSCRVPGESDVGLGGAPCSQTDDGGCTTGFACIAGALVPDCSEQNCCAPLCEIGVGGTCTGAATCNSALMNAAPGFESIGACFVAS